MYLDTHAVVWLYARELDRFTNAGLERIEKNDVVISPMVVLELECLYETGRILCRARAICNSLEEAIGLRVCDRSFSEVVNMSLNQTWTRDPFDRIILAHAKLADAPLLTKDGDIRRHYRKAIWD